MSIREFRPGDRVEGFFLLSGAYSKQSANGKPFLSVELGDASGTIEGKVWDYSGPVSPADTGAVVKIRGMVSEFRGAPQVTVEQIRLAVPGDVYNVKTLVPAAPLDEDDARRELLALVGSIADDDYRRVCQKVLEHYGERFFTIPAAKTVHHGFLHGLLMHTLFMARTADYLAGLYAGVIDRSLLLAGTILHDAAKCEVFNTSPLGLVTEYSNRGQLLGHLVMGAQTVAACAGALGIPEEKSTLLQHLLLSHHGQPEFGAAGVPICAGGELLSLIDTMDSRMEIYREVLDQTPAGTCSSRIFALEHRVYHHH